MKSILHISIYLVVSVVAAGINFVLLPVLSHHLTPADYGTVSIINTYVSLLLPLTSLLSYAILGVQFFKMKDRQEFAQLFSSVLLIPVAPVLLVLLIFLSGQKSLAHLMEVPGKTWVFIYMALFCIFLNVIEMANLYLVTAKKARVYAVFNLGKVILEALLTLYFVVYLERGWEGRIHSWMLVSALFTIISFLIFRKESLLTWDIKKKYISAALLFGLPLIGHTIGKFIVNQSDRLFIAKMITIDEAGIYNVGYTIGSMIMILISALSNYFSPVVMENLNRENPEGLVQVVKANYRFLLVMLGGFVLLNLGAPFLFKWFIDKRYSGAGTYVFWVSLGYLFWGCYMLFAPVIFYSHKTKFLGALSVVNVVLNILLNFLLIPVLGGLGAAIATLLSFVVLFVLIALKSHSLKKLPWKSVQWREIFRA